MTTAQDPAVVVAPTGLVRICSWCVPPVRLAEIHRLHKCSDGICPACLALIDREIA